jgi:hypothetical protein
MVCSVQHRRTELDYQSAVTAQLEQRVASHVLQHQQRTPPPVHRIQRLDQLRAQIERLRKQNEKGTTITLKPLLYQYMVLMTSFTERVEVSALLSEVEHRRRVFDRFVDKMESTARLRTAVLSGRIQPAIKDASEKVKRIDGMSTTVHSFFQRLFKIFVFVQTRLRWSNTTNWVVFFR